MSDIEQVYKHMEKDAFAKMMGIKVIEIRAGYAKASMVIAEQHLNANASTHGAVVFSIMDLVFSAASNSHGNIAVGLNTNTNFFKATMLGDTLYATATEDKLTNRIGAYRMMVEDQAGELVAAGEGLVYRKKERIL